MITNMNCFLKGKSDIDEKCREIEKKSSLGNTITASERIKEKKRK